MPCRPSAPSAAWWSSSPEVLPSREELGPNARLRSRVNEGGGSRSGGAGVAVALAVAAIASPALAHSGHHERLSFAEQVSHLFTQSDHQLAAAGLVVLAVIGGWAWRRTAVRR
jgi:hypothetical protein